MSSFVVNGGIRLSGTVSTSGNKNEALPVIAASILCNGTICVDNMPEIGDVHSMLAIAAALGATVSGPKKHRASIDASSLSTSVLPLELSSIIRGSILFASALLVRTGMAVIPQPGGDSIGRRRIDTHFLVLQALGASLTVKQNLRPGEKGSILYVLEARKGLRGAEVYLDEASVTATENAIIAASGAHGITTIANAASEPHVQGLCRFLKAMGVPIQGIGSNVLTIQGITKFAPTRHSIGSDYIETGSFIGLAAATRSQITITNVDIQYMKMILFQFERLGIVVDVNPAKRSILVPGRQKLVVKRDLFGAIPKIEDNIWPAFPADLISIMIVVATQAKGTCLIHEKMFESRLFFVDTLIAMGAQIVLCDPHRAVIAGPSPLAGASINSPDIRAGMALLIAACAARGTSHIQNIGQIDRGYECIDKRLTKLGAQISRTAERRRDWQHPTRGRMV
jgi:UDP-N-acetylglucosamine 1-carboxyvinyltransferase